MYKHKIPRIAALNASLEFAGAYRFTLNAVNVHNRDVASHPTSPRFLRRLEWGRLVVASIHKTAQLGVVDVI